LDLDTVTTESPASNETTKHMLTACNALQGVRTLTFPKTESGASQLAWKESELRRAALRDGARVMLVGTIRRQSQNARVVLTLVDASSGRILARETVNAISKLGQGFSNAANLLRTQWMQNFSRTDLPHLR